MRVDLVITELDVGGAEKCCVELASHLSKSHQVRVIALGPIPPADRNNLWLKLQREKIETHFLNGHGWNDVWRTKRRLAALVQAAPPQIAMSFLFHANTIASRVYPARSVPLVSNVRVADRSHWRAWFSRWAYRKANRIVCVSQGVAKHVQHYEKARSYKIEVIHNGIDVQDINHDASSFNAKLELEIAGVKQPYLLYIGRFHPQKRIDWLLSLVDQPFFQDNQLQLVMIGSGVLKNQVQAWSQSHAGKLIDLGRRTDVAGWLKHSELLLLPSRYEGMPNVILEAMALSRTVMATDVEGVRELLGSNMASQISSIDDQAGWLGGVETLIKDPELRLRLGHANYQRCQSGFQLTDKMRQYEELLLSLASDRKGENRS